MIRVNIQLYGAAHTFLLEGLLAIGLAAVTAPPALVRASSTWTITGSMSTARIKHTATLLANGQVLAAGGVNSTGFLTSAELYDPTTGKWTTSGSMTTARGEHTHTAPERRRTGRRRAQQPQFSGRHLLHGHRRAV